MPSEARDGLESLETTNGSGPLESTNGPGPRHPEGELLDAYADGERTPGSVDRHVRGCSVCQQTVVALRGVRVELARLAPVSMPPDVARRIQEALTAAPVPSVPSTSGGRRGGPGDRRPAAGRRSAERRRRPMATHGVTSLRPPDHSTMLSRAARPERLMFLAVCLLVVVAGGGLVVALHHAQSSSSSASTAGGVAVAADQNDSPDSAAAAVPNAVAAGTAPEGMVTLASAGSVQSFRIATSRAALDPASVAQHARDLLAGRVPAATAPFAATATAAAPSSGPWAAVATPALLACYRELVDTAHGPLLAVDEVSYRGRDAALVVLDLPDTESTAAPAAGPAAAAPDAALVPASRDRIQLTIVDLGCDVGRLPAATLFAEQSTKAA
ncbi:hypothetical protein I6A60_06510 [Frankia sp. AgB1.9]|uniref:anti-sigma factor family protein n=1 Tax=unclassified Frankia TaxID=2632575 RepID=UPI001933BF4F|nr:MULTISPECIES: hypothetical protein [unclassified Frankia]MBL7489760.1 hypothetical protein [Frankia sp. AgW1.1]MBL7547529.1 hypothetical protein [Frankia sp. AgB1.9]